MAISKKMAFIFKSCIFFFLGCLLSFESFSQAKSDSVNWKDEVSKKMHKANELYASKKGDLNLAAQLVGDVAFYDNRFYQQANLFYFLSLGQSSFDKNPDALAREAQRIIPLLNEKEKSQWQEFITNKDDRLVSKIIRFWDMQDPIPTTKYNERLFEHWYRIRYAQKHFTRNTNSPYGTDDRGTIFVKYGWPDLNIERSIQPEFNGQKDDHSQDMGAKNGGLWGMSGSGGSQGLGTGTGFMNATSWNIAIPTIKVDFNLWQYKNRKGDNIKHYYLFGEKNGMGEFGLRNNPFELLESLKIDIVNPFYKEEFQSLLINWLYENLAIYNSDYRKVYRRISRSNPRLVKYIEKSHNKYLRQQQQNEVPFSSTSLINENTKLESTHKVYRLLNMDNSTSFVISLKPHLKAKLNGLPDSFRNNLSAYTTLSSYSVSESNNRIQNIKKIPHEVSGFTNVIMISDSSLYQPIYYSMDVIGPSNTASYMPGHLLANPRIKWITGQKELTFPEPLPSSGFAVSDVILAHSQETVSGNRIPVTPSINNEFKANKKLMIFFETYGIPDSGYKYEYYFEKHRWLLGNKRMEKKATVTILRDKVDKTDQQLFSIDLTNMESATYDLVIEFNPLKNTQKSPAITKRIELTIED